MHTRYPSAWFGNPWQSLGTRTKILAVDCRDTTAAGTVEHGVRGQVDGYLPRKAPRVLPCQKGLLNCPAKEDFFFPPNRADNPNLEPFSHFIDSDVLGEASGVVKLPGLSRAPGATLTNYICSCLRLDSNA